MCVILAAAAAQAQEAQRLQCRADGELEKSLGVSAEVRLRAETSSPPGVALPKFAGIRPLFAKWITPRVPAGRLWLALDQSGKEGAYDRLYVDTNADGGLTLTYKGAADGVYSGFDRFGRVVSQVWTVDGTPVDSYPTHSSIP
jgi:hypothetical protein